MSSIKLKRFVNIYTGNSISDNDKEKYTKQNKNTIPYISTKDIELGSNKVNYFNDMYIDIEENKKFKIANKGDILLCIEGGSAGKKIARLDYDVCFVNKLCCFKGSDKVYNDFLYYYLQSDLFLSQFNLNMSGLIGGVSQSLIKEFNIPLLSKERQKKIASYLDNRVSLIDYTIENNKKEIELLDEYKWNRISELIKCGFDSESYMSNIQYLGKISKKFKITKLGRIFEIKKDIAGKEGYDVLSITQSGIKIKNIKSNEGQLAADYSKYQLVEVGDFAMNHMDLLTGWVDCSIYNGVTSPDYRVFRNKSKNMYHSDYFLYFLQLCYKQKIFYGMGQGVSNLGRWRLPKENFLNTMVPVPKYEDQRKIANYLDKMVIQLDKVIGYRKQIIEKLEEYKKSLIYEAVTGKIEV